MGCLRIWISAADLMQLAAAGGQTLIAVFRDDIVFFDAENAGVDQNAGLEVDDHAGLQNAFVAGRDRGRLRAHEAHAMAHTAAVIGRAVAALLKRLAAGVGHIADRRAGAHDRGGFVRRVVDIVLHFVPLVRDGADHAGAAEIGPVAIVNGAEVKPEQITLLDAAVGADGADALIVAFAGGDDDKAGGYSAPPSSMHCWASMEISRSVIPASME